MNEQKHPDLSVAILAGGSSSRFGADKALVQLTPDGPSILGQTVSIAASLSRQVAIIGHERYRALDLGVPVIPDDVPGRSPLEGLATALRSLDGPRVLVLACDMPCLCLPLLHMMLDRPSAADAVVPWTADGHWQTMHAIYLVHLLPVLENALAAGMRSVRSLLEHITVDSIDETEIRKLDPELNSFFSLNNPADLERARRCNRRT